MPILPSGTPAWMLTLSCLAPESAWAAQPPSLIVHRAPHHPWVIGIQDQLLNPGKVEIFDHEPQYGPEGGLSPASVPVAILRDAKDQFTLQAARKKYWMVFLPRWTLLNLTLTFRAEHLQATDAATLQVRRLGSSGLEVKVHETREARVLPRIDHFEHAKEGALLTLAEAEGLTEINI